MTDEEIEAVINASRSDEQLTNIISDTNALVPTLRSANNTPCTIHPRFALL